MAEIGEMNILGNLPLSLDIVPPKTESYIEALRNRTDGLKLRKILLCPDNALAQSVAASLNQLMADADIVTTPTVVGEIADAFLLFYDDPEDQSKALMGLLDLEQGIVVAGNSEHSGENRGAFLISIPKAGTHLATELLRELGYRDGGEWNGTNPGCQNWHYLEYSNSHTAAPDFFIDTVRRAPFGNRAHPFPYTPTLFIYRHPYDILVSEANYYHREGKTAFFQYFDGLSFDERVMRLIDDPFLLGKLHDRINKFAAWLAFSNVIPVSFEELIGENGGGDNAIQRRTVWSVILKLQVTAEVGVVASNLFNPDSPTFSRGKIGNHTEKLSKESWEALGQVPHDYLNVFGYQHTPDGNSAEIFSRRIEEFRKRPLRLAVQKATSTPPVLIRKNLLGHNLIKYYGNLYAVPTNVGNLDLAELSTEELSAFRSAKSLNELMESLVREPTLVLGYNVVYSQDKYFGIPVEMGKLDVSKLSSKDCKVILIADSFDQLHQMLIRRFVTKVVFPSNLASRLINKLRK